MSREEVMRAQGAAINAFGGWGSMIKAVMEATGASHDEVIAVLTLDRLSVIATDLRKLVERGAAQV